MTKLADSSWLATEQRSDVRGGKVEHAIRAIPAASGDSALSWFSPQSASGSVLASVFVHGLVCTAVVAILSTNLGSKKVPLGVAELGYEILDAPPEPAKEVKPIKRIVQEATPVLPAQKAPSAVAQELQDSKSDIAGTQTAAQATPQVSGEAASGAAATPYYKIKPKYPKAALMAGDEGWVMLKIDINEAGEVENVRVIDGEKRSLFESEARRAVEKWKYRPFLDGAGHAIRKADHQVRVDFKLQDA